MADCDFCHTAINVIVDTFITLAMGNKLLHFSVLTNLISPIFQS